MSLPASKSFLLTEYIIGATIDQAQDIKNTQIAKELSLPPIKLHHIDPKNPIVVSCKSGKDRTGYISYKADVDQILMRNSDLNVADVNKEVANGGHIQFLASCGINDSKTD